VIAPNASQPYKLPPYDPSSSRSSKWTFPKNIAVFIDVISCRFVERQQYLGSIWCLHIQGSLKQSKCMVSHLSGENLTLPINMFLLPAPAVRLFVFKEVEILGARFKFVFSQHFVFLIRTIYKLVIQSNNLDINYLKQYGTTRTCGILA
jgi:hypothetical protein